MKKGKSRATQNTNIVPEDNKESSPAIKVTKNQLMPPHLHPNFQKSGLSPNFRIKIADLGNGCWTHHHFQPEIQTRQYRSPEVILGINYNETADIWSFACMFYEMITGEFLFDPRKQEEWSKSTDHLAVMMEALRKFPKNYSTIGTNSRKFLKRDGSFYKVPELYYMSIQETLIRKYKAIPLEAEKIQEFLLPMLEIYPQNRSRAIDMLKHSWLKRNVVEIFEDPARDFASEIENHTPGIIDT